MSLMGKFANFSVGCDSRITEEDKVYFEKIQMMYEDSLKYYSRVDALYHELNDKYTKEEKSNREYSRFTVSDLGVMKTVNYLHCSFIDAIYCYYINKYTVSLDKNILEQFKQEDGKDVYKLYDGRRFKPFKYMDVIDEIMSQLGGLEFTDLAEQQLKDKMFKASYNQYFNNWNIEVKNKVVKYKNAWVSEFYGTYTFGRENDFMKNIEEALSRFMYGRKMMLICYPFFHTWSIELHDEDFGWKEYTDGFADDPKLEAIKFYKNGRFDMKFRTAEDAREFAREWCGYKAA